MSGPGGANNANPSHGHRRSNEETARMADTAIIPEAGQNASAEAVAR